MGPICDPFIPNIGLSGLPLTAPPKSPLHSHPGCKKPFHLGLKGRPLIGQNYDVMNRALLGPGETAFCVRDRDFFLSFICTLAIVFIIGTEQLFIS